jgi:glycosyltransferase involved in cell wall biosynthesis
MRPYIVIQGPVATRSGYGAHTRELVLSLIKEDRYDIELISLPWGSTPMNALDPNNPEHSEILKRFAKGNITRKPDIFIQVSIPSEFQPMGKYSIGVTAGFETTIIPGEQLEGCNRMDLIITTSEHSKQSIESSVFDKHDEKTRQKIGETKMEKPCEVLFEGLRTHIFKKTAQIGPEIKSELSDIKDDFCYLFVGHWLNGNIGHDRKDIGMMIKTFCEAFKRKPSSKRPGLILKTSSAKFSIIDRDQIQKKIQQIIAPYGNKAPNIYLLHGDLTDKEMNDLYNHPRVKAMVSFTHGEGFGRPLLEFSAIGKPVIASNWSGHVDFLKHAVLLPGELMKVDSSAANKWLLKESEWFRVNYSYAAQILIDVIDNYKTYQKQAKKQQEYVLNNFTFEHMSELFVKCIDKALESVPKEMKLNLPKLKKVNSANTSKVKLPKLKKVTNEA